MNDPAKAAGGFAYDRASIRKWLDTRKSSPMTNAPMRSKDLINDRVIFSNIHDWVIGKAIGAAAARDFSKQNMKRVKFASSKGHFERHIPQDLIKLQLYDIAYRCIRGSNEQFLLLIDNRELIIPENSALPWQHLQRRTIITICLLEQRMRGMTNFGDFCLIKVFYDDNDVPDFSCWTSKVNINHTLAPCHNLFQIPAIPSGEREARSRKNFERNSCAGWPIPTRGWILDWLSHVQ